jgi:hypothetical protein
MMVAQVAVKANQNQGYFQTKCNYFLLFQNLYLWLSQNSFMRQVSLMVLLALVIMASCKKGKDQENPVITGLRINNASNEVEVAAGNTITVETSIQDSRALGEYKLTIDGVFDGVPTAKKQDFIPFQLTETFPAVNRQDLDYRIFNIPANATAGVYNVVASVKDKGGNEGNTVFFDLIIKNTSTPEFDIINPNVRANWKLQQGDTLSLFGGITDADGLVEVKAALIRNNSETSVYNETIALNPASGSFNLSDLPFIIVPATATLGTYRFHLTGKDTQGNIAVFRKEVTVE